MVMAVVKVGSTFEHLAARCGDYEDWFRACCGLREDEVRVIRAQQGEPLPTDVSGLKGVIVTGSAALVTDREPWSEATGRWLVRMVERDVPVLAVCYGHQLLARALGGEVGFNPRGRQIGTVEVRLHDAAGRDALFRELPRRCTLQVSHVQSVLALPQGATLLADCAGDPHHAFAVGARAWGVQFHPEFSAEVVADYVRTRRAAILQEGGDPDGLITSVRESPDGTRLLRRFAALCGFGAH